MRKYFYGFPAAADIDGQADMKRIYGITAVGEKVRPEKGVKVISLTLSLLAHTHTRTYLFRVLGFIRRISSGSEKKLGLYTIRFQGGATPVFLILMGV